MIPFSQRSKSEAREIGAKGGRNSAKARLRKKHGRELMQALLAMREPDEKVTASLEALGIDTKEMTKEVVMNMRQIEKAIKKGDTQAFKEVNRLAGYLEPEQNVGVNVTNIVVRNEAEAKKIRDIGKIG